MVEDALVNYAHALVREPQETRARMRGQIAQRPPLRANVSRWWNGSHPTICFAKALLLGSRLRNSTHGDRFPAYHSVPEYFWACLQGVETLQVSVPPWAGCEMKPGNFQGRKTLLPLCGLFSVRERVRYRAALCAKAATYMLFKPLSMPICLHVLRAMPFQLLRFATDSSSSLLLRIKARKVNYRPLSATLSLRLRRSACGTRWQSRSDTGVKQSNESLGCLVCHTTKITWCADVDLDTQAWNMEVSWSRHCRKVRAIDIAGVNGTVTVRACSHGTPRLLCGGNNIPLRLEIYIYMRGGHMLPMSGG